MVPMVAPCGSTAVIGVGMGNPIMAITAAIMLVAPMMADIRAIPLPQPTDIRLRQMDILPTVIIAAQPLSTMARRPPMHPITNMLPLRDPTDMEPVDDSDRATCDCGQLPDRHKALA